VNLTIPKVVAFCDSGLGDLLQHGTSAAGSTDSKNFIEASKPLNSGDDNDFSLSFGDTIGFCLAYSNDGVSTTLTTFPAHSGGVECIGTQSLYGDIVVAFSEVKPSTAEPAIPEPKPRPSFVDPEEDPQSYVDRYNNEDGYKEWFDKNYPDYTIYEAVGLPEPVKEKVPGWIKNNARWWAEGQIGDSDFVSGIQFMIKEKIINIPDLPEEVTQMELKDEKRAMGMEREQNVPDWVRNNAGWWADGQISEDDFVNGIKYLVEQGIIKV